MSVKSKHNRMPTGFESVAEATTYLVGVYGALGDEYALVVSDLAQTLVNITACEQALLPLDPGSAPWKVVQDAMRGHRKHAVGLTTELNNALGGGRRQIGKKEQASMEADSLPTDSVLGQAERQMERLRGG